MNRTLFFITLVALGFSIAMTILSANIRLSDSGIDCSPWPECFAHSYKADDQPGISINQHDPNRTTRMLHRTLASVFGLLVLFQFFVAVWYRKTQATGLLLPSIILTLTVCLAVVGLNTPDLIHPIVTLVNLGGGMALCACLFWYLLGFYPTTRGSTVTLIALVAIYVTILSGAWVSANFAAGACEAICTWQGDAGSAFNPRRTLEMSPDGSVIDAQRQLILLAHQAVALVAFSLLIVAAIITRPRAQGGVLIVVTLAMGAVVTAEQFGQSVWLASLHNGLALLLLMLLILKYRRWDRQ